MFLGQPGNMLVAGADMSSHRGLGRVWLAGQDGTGDHAVVTVGACHGVAGKAAGELEPIERQPYAAQRLLDMAIIGHGADGGMVLKILAIVAVEVITRFRTVHAVLQGTK